MPRDSPARRESAVASAPLFPPRRPYAGGLEREVGKPPDLPTRMSALRRNAGFPAGRFRDFPVSCQGDGRKVSATAGVFVGI